MLACNSDPWMNAGGLSRVTAAGEQPPATTRLLLPSIGDARNGAIGLFSPMLGNQGSRRAFRFPSCGSVAEGGAGDIGMRIRDLAPGCREGRTPCEAMGVRSTEGAHMRAPP